MKYLVILFVSFCNIFSTKSQVVIYGTISPVEHSMGLSITLQGTFDGTTIDSNGKFLFSTDSVGELNLEISNPYYMLFSKDIVLDRDSIEVNLNILDYLNLIDEVNITKSVSSINTNNYTFKSARDIYTTAGAGGAVSKALTFLPGVQTVGDREGLFIRGGDVNESKVFMNGLLVNNYFSSGVDGVKGFDRFTANSFSDYELANGGYSAIYGQALAGVLNLKTIDMPEETNISGGVSNASLNASYQYVDKSNSKGLSFSTGYSNLKFYSFLFDSNRVFNHYPETGNYNLNLYLKPSKNTKLKFVSNGVQNKMSLSDGDAIIGLDEKSLFKQLELEVESVINTHVLVNYSKNKKKYYSDIGNTNIDGILLEEGFNAKIINRIASGKFHFTAGAEFNFLEEYYKQQNLYSVFLEGQLISNKAFKASLGARLEYSDYLKKFNISPRLNLVYDFEKNTSISFRSGLYQQSPNSLFMMDGTNKIFYQKAVHYISSIEKNLDNLFIKGELFYMQYSKLPLVKYNGNITEIESFNGRGYARGVELFLKNNLFNKNLEYWISYSFIDSKRKYLDYPEYVVPNFISKHTFSFVGKKMFLDLKAQLSCSYSFNSGKTYSFWDIDNKLSNVETRAYHQLTVGINYLPYLGNKNSKKIFPIINFQISNPIGYSNVLGYKYNAKDSSIVGISPIYDTFVSFGVFFEFGVKSEDKILKSL